MEKNFTIIKSFIFNIFFALVQTLKVPDVTNIKTYANLLHYFYLSNLGTFNIFRFAINKDQKIVVHFNNSDQKIILKDVFTNIILKDLNTSINKIKKYCILKVIKRFLGRDFAYLQLIIKKQKNYGIIANKWQTFI